ncbi:hypothetical protein QBC37DRAFT_427720 [Rhypophila decipiens]|uniref:Ribosomal protein bL31m N-terminal domain-containing protein n=1 Tax=Rhypophila decipiens TaxID=261697 RepID=A0AAN7B5G6_9PEZI|nr:hypothetical protein QBC37DRAFT_427720 [Rhypophila decipiens]
MSTKMGMGKLPSSVLARPQVLLPSPSAIQSSSSSSSPRIPLSITQVRHATFVPRPRRPYTFTQLVQLSDGSTYTVRTTMPHGLLKSTKDSRNHVIWQPSNKSLRNVEVDEAGKLAAFRERFGRGWDLDSNKPAAEESSATAAAVAEAEGKKKKAAEAQAPKQEAAPVALVEEEDPYDSLTDLISSYAVEDNSTKGGKSAKEQGKLDKKK